MGQISFATEYDALDEYLRADNQYFVTIERFEGEWLATIEHRTESGCFGQGSGATIEQALSQLDSATAEVIEEQAKEYRREHGAEIDR